jgi:hypothetical protein
VAEKLQAPSEEEGGATVLEEEQGGADTDTNDGGTAEANPIEALATELGWAPKDQFRGNPDDWKPADEFIRAGREIQRNLSRDLRGVKETVANMSRTSAALLEQQLERQRAELEARFTSAVEEGDPEAARAARTQIDRLEASAPTAQAPAPEGQQFAEKHSSWFGKDREATAYAANRCDHYAKMGLSPARQLAAVEQDMKPLFPELFPAPAKQPPVVAAPGSRTAATSGRKKSFHDLPAEAQKVAKDMAERTGIKIEDYVSNYFAQPERKVG